MFLSWFTYLLDCSVFFTFPLALCMRNPYMLRIVLEELPSVPGGVLRQVRRGADLPKEVGPDVRWKIVYPKASSEAEAGVHQTLRQVVLYKSAAKSVRARYLATATKHDTGC